MLTHQDSQKEFMSSALDLIKNIKSSPAINVEVLNDQKSSEKRNICIEDMNESDQIKMCIYSDIVDVFDKFKDREHFDLGIFTDDCVQLKRKSATYCNVCNRKHNHSNPFLHFNSRTGDISFNCRRSITNESSLIGNINGTVYPIVYKSFYLDNLKSSDNLQIIREDNTKDVIDLSLDDDEFNTLIGVDENSSGKSLKEKVIYVMKCGSFEDPKIYIGETSNIINVVMKLNVKSAWTDLHKPISVIKCYNSNEPGLSTISRTAVVLFYMTRYGIDNVRGGGYCKPNFTLSERRNIQHFLDHLDPTMSISVVNSEYKRISELHTKIFKVYDKFSLNYGQMIDTHFDELISNPDFNNLNLNTRLTRSVKKRFLPNIDFVVSDQSHRRKRT